MLLVVMLLGCEVVEWITGSVDESVDSSGLEALEEAKSLVQDAESSAGKRRVLRVIRRLSSEIRRDETIGLGGNLVAAAVSRVARDGEISNTEAGLVEDAYQRFLDGKIGRGRKGRRGADKEGSDAEEDVQAQ